MRRPITLLALAVAVAGSLSLSGCVMLPLLAPNQAPQQTPQQTPFSPDAGSSSTAPAGWEDLEPCDPSDRWVWVDGYPAEALEASGYEPECGGTYFDRDLPTYVSTADLSMTDEAVASVRQQVEALGFEMTDSTFVQPDENSEPGQAGSWQYELNIDDPDTYEAIYVLTYLHGGLPAVYDVYIDYESPATRVLQR